MIAVGAISSWDDVNSLLLAGRTDLCALGRPHLYDPQLDPARGRRTGLHRTRRSLAGPVPGGQPSPAHRTRGRARSRASAQERTAGGARAATPVPRGARARSWPRSLPSRSRKRWSLPVGVRGRASRKRTAGGGLVRH